MSNEAKAARLLFADGTIQESAAHTMRLAHWYSNASLQSHTPTFNLVAGTVTSGSLIFHNSELFPLGMETLVTFGITGRSRGDNQSWGPAATYSFTTSTPNNITFTTSQVSFFGGHPTTTITAVFVGITEPQ